MLTDVLIFFSFPRIITFSRKLHKISMSIPFHSIFFFYENTERNSVISRIEIEIWKSRQWEMANVHKLFIYSFSFRFFFVFDCLVSLIFKFLWKDTTFDFFGAIYWIPWIAHDCKIVKCKIHSVRHYTIYAFIKYSIV